MEPEKKVRTYKPIHEHVFVLGACIKCGIGFKDAGGPKEAYLAGRITKEELEELLDLAGDD